MQGLNGFKPLSLLAVTVGLVALAHATLGLNAQAATQTVTMKRLGAEDPILLPTIHSARELDFPKPRSWKIKSVRVEATFQHSQQLIAPSWLKIMMNGRPITHVNLDPSNTQTTTINAALPVAAMEQFNRLAFVVDQHYTKKCEDPTDVSLWTNVLASSKLIFDYTLALPKLTFQQFPFPVVDALAYHPTRLRYVLNETTDPTVLTALGLLNASFAQQQPHEPIVSVWQSGESAVSAKAQNVVLIGTAGKLGGPGQRFIGSLRLEGGYRLEGNQWLNGSGQALGAGEGLVAMAENPQAPGHAVLIVSGNSPDGVLVAAKYLVGRPMDQSAGGATHLVPTGWGPPLGGDNGASRFIEKENKTLAQLGFTTIGVEKINAPPITYEVPVVANFADAGSDLVFDVSYSYGPKLNPRYSSLELRLNDRPIANLPLTNPNGQEHARAQVPLPKDLLKVRNQLVAQFHFLPDKYGYCVDKYEDLGWGKIHDDSAFLVQGGPLAFLPNLNLFSLGAGFPYTRAADLEQVQVVMGDTDASSMQTLLALTNRLGRVMIPNITPQLKVGLPAQVDNGANVVLIDHGGNPATEGDGLMLAQSAKGAPVELSFNGPVSQATLLEGSGNEAGTLEQTTSGNRVITRLSASSAKAMVQLANRLLNDEALDELVEGPINRVVYGGQLVVGVNEKAVPSEAESEAMSAEEKTTAAAKQEAGWLSWPKHLWQTQPWLRWIAYALGAGALLLFVVLPILGLILGGLTRKRQ